MRLTSTIWAAGLMVLLPLGTARAQVEVTTFFFTAQAPPGVDSVTVDGRSFDVESDGTFEATVDVPPSATSVSFAMSAGGITRQVDMTIEDLGPPIEGLDVSASELRTFLGEKDAILTWVDAGGKIRVLDTSQATPTVEVLPDTQCVNPLISPDGTRIVYSQGRPDGTKTIFVRSLAGGASTQVGTGDIGYWYVNGSDEYIIFSDWSDKTANGAGGNTYQQRLVTGSTTLDGSASVIHDRAMDAGPNGDLSWLGQVYNQMVTYDVDGDTEYDHTQFALMDGSVADHQTCNGSMAPDTTARLMLLVIPHDWVRIFSHNSTSGSFVETSRFNLPPLMSEWEFPDWSTDPGYFTAVLRSGGLNLRLYALKVAEGEGVPEMLAITPWDTSVSYNHLWVAP